jgi:hypothetical protein
MFSYTATTLPAGTSSFTATAGGPTSNASAPFVITVEAASIMLTVIVVAPADQRQAACVKPNSAQAHYDLGVALASRGNLDLAAPILRKANRLKPD